MRHYYYYYEATNRKDYIDILDKLGHCWETRNYPRFNIWWRLLWVYGDRRRGDVKK